MPRIRRVLPEQAAYVSPAELAAQLADPDGPPPSLPASDTAPLLIRPYFGGTATEPALFEVKIAPGDTESHAHDCDEIIYVLEGELVIGKQSYGPESAIYVPAGTLYHFRIGAEGVRYLNFRPRADTSYVSKDDLVARLAEARESALAEADASSV